LTQVIQGLATPPWGEIGSDSGSWYIRGFSRDICLPLILSALVVLPTSLGEDEGIRSPILLFFLLRERSTPFIVEKRERDSSSR
jgi:hypothetical protein